MARPEADLADDRRAEVESFVTDWVSDDRIPGAALAVVDADGPLYAEGFGARDLESNAPATPETLFGVGSCTKSFTAAVVRSLAADGDLAVDDDVAAYLPYVADAPGDPLTVEELLSHTSGIPSDGSAGPLISRPLGIGHVELPLSSEGDFRRYVEGSLDRRVTDREAFFYYNSGYTMLSKVVEAVTGREFAAVVGDRVLDPLGMERSTFRREAFEAAEDRMTPYVKGDEGTQESAFPFDELIHGPGGLVSSVAEMGAYTRAYLRGGELDGERVLAPETVEAMTTPRGTFGTKFGGREVGYGDGLMVEPFLGDRLVGHGGSIGVSNAWFGYLEAAGLGVALACTTGPDTHPMAVGPAVLAILRGEDPEEVVPHFRLRSALSAVTGDYHTYRGAAEATVERVGGSLRIEVRSGLGAEETPLVPERLDDGLLVCRTVDGRSMDREVRFEYGGEGVSAFFGRDRYERAD
jgi:CubicO group peptidase (beta-lactamase class C family)